MKPKLYKARLILLFFMLSLGLTFTAQATNYFFVNQLAGSQEVPPNASPAQGVISGFYDDATNTLSYGIAFSGLGGNTTAGHFHAPAAPGVNASVVIGYAGFPTGVTSGVYTNTHVISEAHEAQLLAGLWYSNIHTATFPGGEIRGQVLPIALASTVYTFIAPYSGLQEVSPNNSPATGLIMGIYNPATNQIDYGLGFANLVAPTTGGHFHAPAAPGVNAPVIIHHGIPIGVNSGITINSHVISDLQETRLLAGLWYSNIHTSTYPGGEIRAQIVLQGPLCTKPTFLNTLPIVGDATCGNNDGQISIIPTSGAAPFMYSLDGGTTYNAGPDVGFTQFNLAAGMYTLRLKDANGCESDPVQREIKTINCPTCTPPTFLNTLPIIGNATCGQNDGQIVIIPTSGTAPFMYSIDGGATYSSGPDVGVTFFNMAAGTYQLRLKDANGCESEVIVRTVETINCPPSCTPPTFLNTLPIIGNATCGQNDGQIVLIPTSGTGPFMYSIDGGATYVAGPNVGYTFFNVPAGTYQLRIKSGTDCESDVVERTVATINCPSAPAASARNSVGFERVVAESKMTVTGYPNPSRGKFRLQVQHFDSPKAEVSIFDGKGTLVQKSIMNLAKGTTLDVNLTGKAPGIYSVKVLTSKGVTTSKVLIQ